MTLTINSLSFTLYRLFFFHFSFYKPAIQHNITNCSCNLGFASNSLHTTEQWFNNSSYLAVCLRSKISGAYPVTAVCRHWTRAILRGSSPADMNARSTNTFSSFKPPVTKGKSIQVHKERLSA